MGIYHYIFGNHYIVSYENHELSEQILAFTHYEKKCHFKPSPLRILGIEK